jgi:glycosyltransferase involved in cell wall biosynthesis
MPIPAAPPAVESASGAKVVHGLVSVVIPAYNAARYITECLDSVLYQTYPRVEIIVVDDGSTDDTRTVLAPYIATGKIKYLYRQNRGPGAARNLAIQNSTGEFIAFLDADDLWLPEKLEKQLALFRNRPEVGMVYSDSEFFGEEWERQKKISPKLRAYENGKSKLYLRGHVYRQLLDFNFIVSNSVVVRRSVLEKTGLFLEKIRGRRFSYGEDFELWLRIAKVSAIDFTLEKLARRRFHPRQLTHSKIHGYRQLCCLYQHLFLRDGWRERPLIARKYLENTVKQVLMVILGQRTCEYLAGRWRRML